MEDQFIVINDTLINLSRLLYVAHKADTNKLEPFYETESEIPERAKPCYVQAGERWELDPDVDWSNEEYIVMFDTGKDLHLKSVDGKPLMERLRFRSNPSDGKSATTSEDAT